MTFSLKPAIKSLAVNILLLPDRWRTGVAYNPLSGEMVRDPYPVYARLGERSPVHHSRLMSAFVLSRYADVDRILRDHALFSSSPDLRKSPKTGYQLLGGPTNRDPDAFENPDQLDFNREKPDHVSFARGIHYCLGAALARLEGRIAFEMLPERFDSLPLLTERPAFRPFTEWLLILMNK